MLLAMTAALVAPKLAGEASSLQACCLLAPTYAAAMDAEGQIRAACKHSCLQQHGLLSELDAVGLPGKYVRL